MTRLIIALDFNDSKKAIELATLLRPKVAWFKVGLELFISAGPAIIRRLADLDCKIFLDLKIYDIPNTAGAAARAAILPGVGLFTVHLQGGRRMCAAVSDALAGSDVIAAGATALTSFAQGEMPGIDLPPAQYGLWLASKAEEWGLGAIVCAAGEAAAIRAQAPGLRIICPGIRFNPDQNDDQTRTATPKEAANAGADYIVVGRPVTQAKSPLDVASKILKELGQAT